VRSTRPISAPPRIQACGLGGGGVDGGWATGTRRGVIRHQSDLPPNPGESGTHGAASDIDSRRGPAASSRAQRLLAWLGRHPWVGVRVVLGMLVALALWPVWSLRSPQGRASLPLNPLTLPGQSQAKPLTVQPVPPTAGGWYARSRMGPRWGSETTPAGML